MFTLRIGQTVERVSSPEHNTRFTITTPRQLAYHKLLTKTYKYILVEDAPDDSFDLPEVKGNLRIHRKPFEECDSCSG